MKYAYAFRRAVFQPYYSDSWALPPRGVREKFLKKVATMGFNGLELGLDTVEFSEKVVKELRKELEAAGTPCVVIRGGGGLTHPRVAAQNRRRLEQAVKMASWIGAEVVNTTVATPPTAPGAPGSFVGDPVSQGSSRQAREEDFVATARGLAQIADMAASLGIKISIEVHQHSIADNSWSALHLLELIDRPNVGINPDLGNIYWNYDVPEETSEAAIVALAPKAIYWHCKSLKRVHIPENKHSIFLQVPLPDGDIDYRFAIATMLEAGYSGYLAIEGTRFGDQLSADQRSLDYVKGLVRELTGE